jgi:hypothetical protein
MLAADTFLGEILPSVSRPGQLLAIPDEEGDSDGDEKKYEPHGCDGFRSQRTL